MWALQFLELMDVRDIDITKGPQCGSLGTVNVKRTQVWALQFLELMDVRDIDITKGPRCGSLGIVNVNM